MTKHVKKRVIGEVVETSSDIYGIIFLFGKKTLDVLNAPQGGKMEGGLFFFSMTPAVIEGSSWVKESKLCHSGWLGWRVMVGVGMCLCVGWKEAVKLRRWLTLTLCHQYHSTRTSHAGSPLDMPLFFNVVVIVTVSFTRQTFSNQAVLEMILHAGPEGIRVEASFVSAEREAHFKKLRWFTQ